jgi:hypothetical protein
MALTEYQRGICRLIAANRIERGDAYIAGRAALNALLNAPRLSRDVDLFHDTGEALAATWEADRALLADHGYSVQVVRERPAYVEALAARDGESVLMQWTCDSAFRFFPLLPHEDLGLTLHPLDLATNKVLALAGRVEPRDWIDLMECHRTLQSLGCLAWAASGKDPGFSPARILQEASRSVRYTQEEISELDFDGPAPDAAALSLEWKQALADAQRTVALLPAQETGKCVLDAEGRLYRGDSAHLGSALAQHAVRYHQGSIQGAFPQFANGGSP